MESKETSVPQACGSVADVLPPPPMSFFNEDLDKQTPVTKGRSAKKDGTRVSSPSDRPPVHPFEEYDDFHDHPPIPAINYIINRKTGELMEDRTGQP